MDNFTVEYTFVLGKDQKEVFRYEIDGRRLELLDEPSYESPEWSRLSFHQCANCPLAVEAHPYCPLAVRLVDIVNRFQHLVSHTNIQVRVKTEERVVAQNTTAQRAISSLVGLLMATSGCPGLAYFKPMARFHLPLSSEAETIYRATSMYLLAQYFVAQSGQPADYDLSGLKRIYDNIHEINNAIAERLRAAAVEDSSVNALILLDLYTTTMPIVIEESLDEMAYLFQPFVERNPREAG